MAGLCDACGAAAIELGRRGIGCVIAEPRLTVSQRDARQLIDAAAGVPAGATVLSTDPWTARMQIVDRMQHGRVWPGPALVLVRPDQYVAWTGDAAPGDPSALLDLVRGAGGSLMREPPRAGRARAR